MTRSAARPHNDEDHGLRYIVRGGPIKLIGQTVTLDRKGFCGSVNQHVKHEGLGLRCARSPRPRLSEEDFLIRLP
jgi:hypothetical protein